MKTRKTFVEVVKLMERGTISFRVVDFCTREILSKCCTDKQQVKQFLKYNKRFRVLGGF